MGARQRHRALGAVVSAPTRHAADGGLHVSGRPLSGTPSTPEQVAFPWLPTYRDVLTEVERMKYEAMRETRLGRAPR